MTILCTSVPLHRIPQATLLDSLPMAESLRTVCAWCTTPVPGNSDRVSHGICIDCALAFLSKLPREYLASIADPDGTVTLFSGHKLDLETGRPR